MIFNPKTLALFITLLFILGSCKNNGKSQLYNQIHLDSIKINEIKSLISEFIKSNIASEYFSLQRSPLSYDWGDINDSTRLANPTFHKLILKKMENDELNKDQIPWSETIAPRAVIIGELKLDDQTNIFLDKKIAALPNNRLCQMANPIFNEDYSLALLKYVFVCGSRCATSKTVLYKKIDGVWKEFKVVSGWLT